MFLSLLNAFRTEMLPEPPFSQPHQRQNRHLCEELSTRQNQIDAGLVMQADNLHRMAIPTPLEAWGEGHVDEWRRGPSTPDADGVILLWQFLF
jgi:hypothetical protein